MVCSVFLYFVASETSDGIRTPVIRLVTEPGELLFPVMAAQCVFVGSFPLQIMMNTWKVDSGACALPISFFTPAAEPASVSHSPSALVRY